jgi:peptide/nickel transport system permease protein
MLEPAIMLMLTGLAFSLLGFALDRVFNPRLRGL